MMCEPHYYVLNFDLVRSFLSIDLIYLICQIVEMDLKQIRALMMQFQSIFFFYFL